MGTTRIRIEPGDPATLRQGRIDAAKVDGTTEAEIRLQQLKDDVDAMQDAARARVRAEQAEEGLKPCH